MSGFCERAWQHTATLRAAMIELPINRELAEGTLSRERFQFYLLQDARYLVGFARALSVAAARAPDTEDVVSFAGAARDAIVVERELHAGYFVRFGLTEADVEATEPSPTCLAYTSYLLAVAQSGSYGELVAALLPCFWVYHEVGQLIVARQSGTVDGPDQGNPYQEWIDTYADEEFGAAVARCRDAADRAADAAVERERERMLAAFTRATEYEWMFWDSAYRMESWPTRGLRG